MRKKMRVVMFLAVLFILSPSALLRAGMSKEVWAFTLPDTGQTKCYDTAGTGMNCTGTGQDGAYSINPMSYTDNGDGTITDNVTGLMWQKGENATYYNWHVASGTYNPTYNASSQNVCGSLSLGGHSDWRLPAKKELITLVDYSIPYPVPTINATYFPNTYANYYWSSTIYAGSTNSAWNVYFNGGYVSGYLKSSSGYVRCVRGGQSSPSFTDNGNGTITDNRTGLVWQQGEPGSKTWVDALTYCEGLSLGGQTDWRLPNIKELESITDNTTYNPDPAIDISFFPNTYVFHYWSSTTNAYNRDQAWKVNFDDGGVDVHSKSYNRNDVRCVRGDTRPTSCTYIISPTSQTFTSSGGSDSVTVTASASTCAWTSSSSLSWVTITTGSGTGNGTVTISVAANTSTNSRTGTITIAGQPFAITQAGAIQNNCAATLSDTFLLHEPYFTINGSFLWLDLQYAQDAQFPSTDIMFKLSNAGGVTNPSVYSGCQASALSVVGTNYVLRIPVVLLGGTSYWLDLIYVPTKDGLLWFKLTNFGVN